ncbi:tRNA 2-thiouridine(34) synthase MnmA [Malacoplasma iowae]|uniref:tRNA-specific 2-thiouridylase MnmA n=2 Tax=Malacoplasma iowae TaxID=2116 RepID=A0A084U4H5_MALIO|nr:tRNA 2-thiouridine(34) synthase MnmA [Malacoplasma iowae]VEU62508.1 tRNA-specific 2-thiouridylase mnmA [Mycoplasmopsis fermentans]EGZ31406.1 tRNA-(5-methylaminomethyl-2-thiouridylate) methyltransferase [Malacoplasma iowae 695]KFB07861.1 tRNA (5-methylaminomethyl-2-thiouridylate)-methyltransferase [Malacoplasma iowae DK-CPA]QHG89737.1 tRNA 2-thiouridine(34) synthase MnmA [Malacoplasma iowae 695]WPL35468.1 tRNA 2-thiouridine(34) synthase MnmA [Malacoplasma iowae]
MNKTIVVGMSGGVDSSVTALILKKAGFKVIGLFMQNWDNLVNNELNFESSLSNCSASYDYNDAKVVCEKLDIPLYKIDFIKEYWDKVFTKFIDDYKSGKTPNPDVLCNKYIKFDLFIKHALKTFNADYIATGHYAKIKKDSSGTKYLCESFDKNKDQTYFLNQLSQAQIANVIFPLANLSKECVREIAKKYDLINWDKKDSTGICFIGERDIKKFLANYIDEKEGDIIDITTNEKIGTHKGVHLYTIGQRKGMNLSGNKKRQFVCKKDVEKNIIYVTDKLNDSSYLMSNYCELTDFNWISKIPYSDQVEVRFRHTQAKQNCRFKIFGDKVYLFYENKSESVTVGQYAVIYKNGICLGGGTISQTWLIE